MTLPSLSHGVDCADMRFPLSPSIAFVGSMLAQAAVNMNFF